MNLHELLERINNLKRIPRTGWLFCSVPLGGVEDVAQHSFEVATITMLLADGLKREGKKIDSERAIRMALLHDWAEAEVADFPYTALKHLESVEVKRKMEQSALEGMLQRIPEKAKYLALWQEYNDKHTLESKLVHAADYLSILFQAVKYREQGISSRELDRLWQAVKGDLTPYLKDLKIVASLVDEIEASFNMKRQA